jgi:uncharacterized YccA/Bax inhibitor family protein
MDTTFRTSNPAFRDSVFQEARSDPAMMTSVMTVQGAAVKSLILVGLVLAAAIWTWTQTFEAVRSTGAPTGWVLLYVVGGGIGGFIMALVTTFMPRVSPWTAPIYAVLEGLVLGGISAIFEIRFEGIVLEAVMLTMGVLVFMLLLYASGMVTVTEKFKTGVIAATGAIALVYLITFLLGVFGVRIPYIHDAGPVGIIFSVIVVAIAALNLLLDFDLIAQNAAYGAPKYMEWYCGFGLLVTLVWLYLEVLRLLAKVRSNRN